MNFLEEAKSKLHNFADDIRNALDGDDKAQTFDQNSPRPPQHDRPASRHSDNGEEKHHSNNRYESFAPERHEGNQAKWFVDGCGYMWAVSVAIEEARESIWILDWWLSPELYLRRPPSENEQYRIDRMLLAAAERGVKVNVIVYKEVSQILTLCSEHTKKALELHPNIAVFRHPDHVPTGQAFESSLFTSIKNFKSLQLADLPSDSFKALYGMNKDVVLYWAHHEKLCLVDSRIAFMGGLDLCFGRWDTNSHPLADAHPTDVSKALFPGQDFNNARVYDFEDVTKWEDNKLDRTKNGRMGWSDLSICLRGPIVEDLKAHFVQRWDFIWGEKYDTRQDARYTSLQFQASGIPQGYYDAQGKVVVGASPGQLESIPPQQLEEQRAHHFRGAFNRFRQGFGEQGPGVYQQQAEDNGPMSIQLVRSCCPWSNGVPTEHSIQNAYISVIQQSEHFIYIENQFFITATNATPHPVTNKIGAALVDRIVRAHNENQKFKIIVCMPSVPAFAGDLHDKDSLGTRAIMEYQYHSICRGGYSIMEEVERAGVPDAKEYIRFYNLRNYDRINAGSGTATQKVEDRSGIDYEDARKEHDDLVGAGYDGRGEGTDARYGQQEGRQERNDYDRYQEAAEKVDDSRIPDSISGCYMENGEPVTQVPWAGSEEAEMDAFVSEELYIHSKLLIADDRIVICGSANLNDRSQVGDHDSEIAVVISDPTPVQSSMNGQQYTASQFAASLRRQLFRKHLGLLPWQDWTRPTSNFMPIDKGQNEYDFGSQADQLVQDPLSVEFEQLWNGTAATNTQVFAKAFHCVPADNVRNWDDYKEFFSNYFVPKGDDEKEQAKPENQSPYLYGHVVKEEFPGGVRELKESLQQVRGTLVEMPLLFMDGVDFAKEGLSLNALTDEIYT